MDLFIMAHDHGVWLLEETWFGYNFLKISYYALEDTKTSLQLIAVELPKASRVLDVVIIIFKLPNLKYKVEWGV